MYVYIRIEGVCVVCNLHFDIFSLRLAPVI